MKITLLILFSSLLMTCSIKKDKNIKEVIEFISFKDIENTNQLSELIATYKLCDGKYWLIYLGDNEQILLTQSIKNAVFEVFEKEKLYVTQLGGQIVFVKSKQPNLIEKSNVFFKTTHKAVTIADFPFDDPSFWIIKRGVILKKNIISCN